jgi:lipid A 4'-phosphatase
MDGVGGGPESAMRYLRLRRSQLILTCFATCSLMLVAFPAIDLGTSAFFYLPGGFSSQSWWQTLMHEGMPWFLVITMASVVGMYLYNRICKKSVCGLDGRKVVYLFLVLIIGAGLIVNVILKDNFGRARPRDIAQFGGVHEFTAPFVMADACRKNCSFASGEGAGGFFALALASALTRRRAALAAALGFGMLVSLSRIASGAHFLSDTVVSFFVMLTLADVLYYFVVLSGAERAEIRLRGYPALPART